MSMRPILQGSTDQSVVIRIIDDTTGLPETGVVWNTAGIDMWYRREGAVSVDIVEAIRATLDAAHADGGFLHINDGYYRLDLPDAAVAAGANGVMVAGAVTGMIVIGCYVPLVAYNPYDAVRMGMTALPNAAADAAGGLPISDAGGLDLDTQLANTSEVTAARMAVLTDWINGGRLDLLLDAITAAGPTKAEMDAAHALLATPAQVKTQAVAALNTDTYAEPGQEAPTATTTLVDKIGYLFKFLRNKITQDGTTIEVYNDAGAVVDQKAPTAEVAGTVTRGEFISGP